MTNNYQIYLISDSTGETLDRIFIAIKAQFKNIDYKVHTYSFTRTENQIFKILSEAEKNINSIILYSIVDSNLAKYLANTSSDKKIPCFGVLGDLILSFSKLLNQKPGKGGEIHITDAIQKLIQNNKKFIAHNFSGKYLDCGSMSGYIKSSLEIAKS